MKIKHIIITTGMAVVLHMPIFTPAFAVSGITPICTAMRCTASSPTNPDNEQPYCKTYSDSCYPGPHRIRSCDTCNTGYERTQVTTTLSGCTGSVTYYTCIYEGGGDIGGGDDDCDGTCTDCESTDWTSDGIGREAKTVATCNTDTCECSKMSSRRCIAGYYGLAFPQFGSTGTGCTRCPSPGTSVAGDNRTITKCYSTRGSDATGTFEYTQNCYYTSE